MRKNNVKSIVTCIIAAMVLSCSACGNGKDSSQNKDNGSSNVEATDPGEKNESVEESTDPAEPSEASEKEDTSDSSSADVSSGECMQKIYDALTAEGSDYAELKAMDTSSEYSESLDGDKITLSVKGDYSNGSYEFVLDGDYITTSFAGDDYTASGMFTYICSAVGEYLGMDKNLMSGYLKGLGIKKMKNDYIIMDSSTSGDDITYKVYVGGKYDFSEMDSWYIDSDVLENTSELGEDTVNNIAGIGKVIMYSMGSRDSLDMYVAEYGDSGELTYKSLIEAVKKLKPDGYKSFIKKYKKLEEKTDKAYKVTFPTGADDLPEAFGKLGDAYKYVKVHFGK